MWHEFSNYAVTGAWNTFCYKVTVTGFQNVRLRNNLLCLRVHLTSAARKNIVFYVKEKWKNVPLMVRRDWNHDFDSRGGEVDPVPDL